MKEKYQDFALFVEDVNIKTEVFEVLWDLPSYKVKEIMDEFHNKSLIVRKYNTTTKCYVYGIHDLLLYYLRKKLDKEGLKELHQKLLSRYKAICNGNLALLPKNDNYFFYYVGYHIAKAELYPLFAEWYFDLDFIEAKLKVAGPGDLLLDYKRYSVHYDQPKIVKKLQDYVKFVESIGLEVRKNNGPDIVQFALQEPHDSEVYKTGIRLAQSRPDSTYLNFQLGIPKSRSAPHTIQAREKVSCACFSNDNNNLIVGFELGAIQIMNQKGFVTRVYEGHVESVSRICVSSKKAVFLSMSKKCVKVWKLPDLDSSVSFGSSSGSRTPSPSQRQTNFTDMFNYKTVEKRTCWFSEDFEKFVDWATFSTDGSKIAICCSEGRGRIVVRNTSSQHPNKKTISGYCATSCIFSHNDELLITGCSNSFIYIHQLDSNITPSHCVHTHPILALFPLPGSKGEIKFGALSKFTLCVWEGANEKNKSCVPCLRDYHKGEGETYVCCAAAPDGSFVAVATSTGKVLICDLSDGSVVCCINYSNGKIQYLAMDDTKELMLLGCCGNATMELWKLAEVISDKPSRMKSNFAVAWTNDHMPILAAPTFNPFVKKNYGNNKTEDLRIPVDGDINICGISKCGNYVTASTSRGEVFLHVEDSKTEMVKVFTVDKYISKHMVEVSKRRIYIIIGLERYLKVWTCREENIFNTDEAHTFTIPLSSKLVQYFMSDEENLYTVSSNGSIQKCNLNTQETAELYQYRFDVEVCDASLSCLNVLATLESRKCELNLYSLDLLLRTNKLADTPSCCSFSLDGSKLAIGFNNGLIQVLDVSTLKIEFSVSKTGEKIESICVSNQGLVGAATKVRVMMVTTEGRVGQAKMQVHHIVMSPNDTTIITVDSDGHMHLINLFKDTKHCTVKMLVQNAFSFGDVGGTGSHSFAS